MKHHNKELEGKLAQKDKELTAMHDKYRFREKKMKEIKELLKNKEKNLKAKTTEVTQADLDKVKQELIEIR